MIFQKYNKIHYVKICSHENIDIIYLFIKNYKYILLYLIHIIYCCTVK